MPKKHWSKNLEESGIKIRIYERSGSSSIWYSVIEGGQKRRKSLKTGDRTLAQERACAVARELAEAHFTGRDLRSITLGHVFSLYFRLKADMLSPKWKGAAEMRRDLFLLSWGADQPVEDISSVHVDRFCRERRSKPTGSRPTGTQDQVRARRYTRR